MILASWGSPPPPHLIASTEGAPCSLVTSMTLNTMAWGPRRPRPGFILGTKSYAAKIKRCRHRTPFLLCSVVELAKAFKRYPRGELEFTSLNLLYLEWSRGGSAHRSWARVRLDTGAHDLFSMPISSLPPSKTAKGLQRADQKKSLPEREGSVLGNWRRRVNS